MKSQTKLAAGAYPNPTSPAVSAVMRANRKTDSKPEVNLRSRLHRRGVRFRKNLAILLEAGTVRPDVVFPRHKVAVFVDGCFWHACAQHGTQPRSNSEYWSAKLARNVARDRLVDGWLGEAGWVVIRVWEHASLEAMEEEVVGQLASKEVAG